MLPKWHTVSETSPYVPNSRFEVGETSLLLRDVCAHPQNLGWWMYVASARFFEEVRIVADNIPNPNNFKYVSLKRCMYPALGFVNMCCFGLIRGLHCEQYGWRLYVHGEVC